MVVLTAKVDFKKILLILALVAAALLGILLLFGNSEETFAKNDKLTGNESRIRFLQSFGWEVDSTPKESSQVIIPEESSQVFERYNALQKCQGYDLSKYAGKRVMRYVYTVKNYPGATQPVYATLLVYKDKAIGGDITDTSPGGKIQGFNIGSVTPPETQVLPSSPQTSLPKATQ